MFRKYCISRRFPSYIPERNILLRIYGRNATSCCEFVFFRVLKFTPFYMSPQHVEHTNKNFETSTFHYCDLKFSIFIISQLNSYLKIQWFQIRAWIRLIRAKFCEKSRVQDSEKLFLRTVFIDFPRKFWYKRLSISRGFYIRIYARNKKKRLSVL